MQIISQIRRIRTYYLLGKYISLNFPYAKDFNIKFTSKEDYSFLRKSSSYIPEHLGKLTTLDYVYKNKSHELSILTESLKERTK